MNLKNLSSGLNWPSLTRHITVYRLAVAIGFIIAIALSIAIPAKMSDPDDWAYYYGVRNFANGQLTVDTQTHQQQVYEAQKQGGQLIQYYNIGNNRWALEKAPGYVFYLVPFELLGIPRYGNVLLALGMIIVTFLLLKRLRDEKTAMIGCLLMLFTPLSLVMLNRSFMDTYASLAFLVMGGGLYLYYHLERSKLSGTKGGLLLFLAFFLISWSVISRYTNLPVAAVLGLHYLIIRINDRRSQNRVGIKKEIIAVLLGTGLPILVILFYDYLVFGSPWTYGYDYTRFPIKFAFQYWGQVNQDGQSIPWQIILNNLKNAPRALLVGYPLLFIAIPGLIFILLRKGVDFTGKNKIPGSIPGGIRWLSWDILIVLILWFIAVFGLYLTYEWTADFRGGGGFVMFDRFYLPGLFPLAVIAALILGRLPGWLYIPLILVIAVFGSMVYLQWALNLNILPGWILNGTGGRGPGGDRPGNFPNRGFPGGGQPPGGYSPGRLPGGNSPGRFPWGDGYFQPPYGGGFSPPGR
jgi:hypothetical protein